MKLIIKHILSHHNNISKRLQSYHHVIKIDAVLGNLKFSNKGEKDPIYGMVIPMEMMSDKIKTFTDYSNYLAKFIGDKSVKGKGKGLLTRKGVEVAVQKIETVRVPKKKRTKTGFTMSQMKKLWITQRSSGEGFDVIPEVPDELSDHSESSSSESKDEERFLTTDDDNSNGDARKKKTGDDKARNIQAKVSKPEPQVEKPAVQPLSSSLTLSSAEYGNQFITDNPDVSLIDVLKELVEVEVQSLVDVLVLQEKPVVQRTSLTKLILKKSKKPKDKVDAKAVLQRLIRLEKKVDSMSKIDNTNVIETSVQAYMMNDVKNQLLKFLPKVMSNVVQPKIETIVHDVLNTYTTSITLYQPPSTSTDSLTEYELKLKLYNMMQASHSFLDHEKHLTLYNALINSINVDEANVQGSKDTTKRCHDIQDPPVDADKDSKKRKRKDADTPSSKIGKTQSKSSKEAKAPNKPSATDKAVDDEELRQDDAELVKDDDMAHDEMPQDDDAPTQDRSKWFKQDEVMRPETPDPEWFKEPNANHALKQPWFNDMVNAEKDPQDFDNLMGSTIDFTKFAKNRFKKDKITKADLEGPIFKLLKGGFNNNIELEYNMEQCYLVLTDQIDWVNPEGDRCPYNPSKLLPLQGPPGRTTIHVDFFVNQDLKYL
ncbi:hypothetical protein Tco_0167951 [Tanacetum coccineum]